MLPLRITRKVKRRQQGNQVGIRNTVLHFQNHAVLRLKEYKKVNYPFGEFNRTSIVCICNVQISNISYSLMFRRRISTNSLIKENSFQYRKPIQFQCYFVFVKVWYKELVQNRPSKVIERLQSESSSAYFRVGIVLRDHENLKSPEQTSSTMNVSEQRFLFLM